MAQANHHRLSELRVLPALELGWSDFDASQMTLEGASEFVMSDAEVMESLIS
jgi:hypothetical protein